jgi:hypothetical protein
MKYPLAWYLTWTTYGTWLHGDARGSNINGQVLPPDPSLEASMRAQMTEDPVYLSDAQRVIVDNLLVAECRAQGWLLHARNVRTNHVHIVLSALREVPSRPTEGARVGRAVGRCRSSDGR